MPLDLSKSYDEAKSKTNAIKSANESISEKGRDFLNNSGNNFEKTKSEALKQLNSLGDVRQKAQQQIKGQFEELIDLLRIIVPERPNINLKPNININTIAPERPNINSNTIDFILEQLLQASQNTKSRIGEIFTEETIKAAGCSQEETYNPNVPVYIKLKQIDFKKTLKNSFNQGPWDLEYESQSTGSGQFPFSLNRELYNLTQNQSTFTLQGISNNNLFDIKYTNQRPLPGGGFEFDDFYEIIPKARQSGNNISDLISDYFKSIEIVDFDNIINNLMNSILNSFDISAKISVDQKQDQDKFGLLLSRILGLCFDDNQEIDVAGTAKLGQLDNLDQSFFQFSPIDLRIIENEISDFQLGVTEFTDCDNIKLPVNTEQVLNDIREIRQLPDGQKVEAFIEMINKTSNNNDWKNLISPSLNINLSMKFDLLRDLPRTVFLSLLTPKAVLGIMVALRLVGNTNIDSVEDFETFVTNLRKFTVNAVTRLGAIFVEELFILLKENVRELVQILLLEIAKETTNKQITIITRILYVLLQLTNAIIDYRKCESVIDEILKLLNLVSIGGIQIPSFALLSAGLLPGFSRIRAFANAIEEMQKKGLPTGALPDGSPNQVLQFLKSSIDGMDQEETENGKVSVAMITPAGPVSLNGKKL